MRAVSIASGSKGNCIYVETNQCKFLVDIGISCSLLEEKLKLVNIDPSTIDAVFVTHEHSDHCSGLGAFARKYKTKIYMHTSGFPFVNKKLGKISPEQIVCFANTDFFVGDTTISTFPIPHDSNFCIGYVFNCDNKRVAIATDMGHYNNVIINKLVGVDLIYLESNHDEQVLLNNPKYSATLKNRILSPKGHLSNVNCGKLITELVGGGLKQIILSHLSEENNTPLLAYTTVKQVLQKNGIIEGEHVCVDVATQHKIGTFFEIQ